MNNNNNIQLNIKEVVNLYVLKIVSFFCFNLLSLNQMSLF